MIFLSIITTPERIYARVERKAEGQEGGVCLEIPLTEGRCHILLEQIAEALRAHSARREK